MLNHMISYIYDFFKKGFNLKHSFSFTMGE